MGASGPYLFSTSFRLTSQLLIQLTHQLLYKFRMPLFLTLKWTWMWSLRTSTRKNLRPQISQVYFLSPWVSKCLFMLLRQENTLNKKLFVLFIYSMLHRSDMNNKYGVLGLGTPPFHKLDTPKAPFCICFPPPRSLQAPLVSCFSGLWKSNGWWKPLVHTQRKWHNGWWSLPTEKGKES